MCFYFLTCQFRLKFGFLLMTLVFYSFLCGLVHICLFCLFVSLFHLLFSSFSDSHMLYYCFINTLVLCLIIIFFSHWLLLLGFISSNRVLVLLIVILSKSFYIHQHITLHHSIIQKNF